MGKNLRGHKERSKEQELKFENAKLKRAKEGADREVAKLKREILSLRRDFARMDLSRVSHVKEMLEEHAFHEDSREAETVLKQMSKHWHCFKCKDGVLEIVVFPKMGKMYYFRQCNNCTHRTIRTKEYTPEIKGVLKKNVVKD
jgi:hypothetical protein